MTGFAHRRRRFFLLLSLIVVKTGLRLPEVVNREQLIYRHTAMPCLKIHQEQYNENRHLSLVFIIVFHQRDTGLSAIKIGFIGKTDRPKSIDSPSRRV
jgi:hypothetical protein